MAIDLRALDGMGRMELWDVYQQSGVRARDVKCKGRFTILRALFRAAGGGEAAGAFLPFDAAWARGMAGAYDELAQEARRLGRSVKNKGRWAGHLNAVRARHGMGELPEDIMREITGGAAAKENGMPESNTDNSIPESENESSNTRIKYRKRYARTKDRKRYTDI